MTKLRIMSDIHLDSNNGWTPPIMEDDAEQVLILAGDIATFCNHRGKYKTYDWFWEEVVKRFKAVLYTPGNHDYYHGDLKRVDTIMRKHLTSIGINYMQEDIVEIDGILFAGCTLWTDFDEYNLDIMNMAQQFMTDYQATKFGKRHLSPLDIVQVHKNHASFLELAAEKRTDVLITHHLPNKDYVHPYWVDNGGTSNYLYHANIDWKTLDMFNLTICGHTHTPRDFLHNDTRCIINPKGYQHEKVHDFNPKLVVEVN